MNHRVKFPGQHFDAETSLHYNYFRTYDPTLGRYLEHDPIGLAGGWNRYAYVQGNPLANIDPQGLNPAAIGGAAFGPGGLVIGAGITCGMTPACRDLLDKMIVQPVKALCNEANDPDKNQPIPDGDASDTRAKPPAGSKPIDQTPWSGDHKPIKEGIRARPDDNVKIDPQGNVWGENSDGSWSNHGPAGDFTGSGRPSGQRGKDRGKR
jgi:RHS repeat-associated protein